MALESVCECQLSRTQFNGSIGSFWPDMRRFDFLIAVGLAFIARISGADAELPVPTGGYRASKTAYSEPMGSINSIRLPKGSST
jgi:hypothetical protein